MESARGRLRARTIAHAVAIAMGAGLIDPWAIPALEAGDGGMHRVPHTLMEDREGIAYDPRCPACRDHGSWREGVADLRFNVKPPAG